MLRLLIQVSILSVVYILCFRNLMFILTQYLFRHSVVLTFTSLKYASMQVECLHYLAFSDEFKKNVKDTAEATKISAILSRKCIKKLKKTKQCHLEVNKYHYVLIILHSLRFSSKVKDLDTTET